MTITLRAKKISPDEPLVQAQLGHCYYFLGRMEDAEQHLRLVKDLEQGHFSFPQLLLADIYAMRQDMPAAVRELEQFLRLHPDSSRATEVRKSLDVLLASPPTRKLD